MIKQAGYGEGAKGSWDGSILAGGCPTKSEQEKEIPEMLMRLASQAERLHSKLNELENRLSPIRHNRPSAASDVKQSKELVPLAEGMRVLADRISSACYRIDELCQTIEL